MNARPAARDRARRPTDAPRPHRQRDYEYVRRGAANIFCIVAPEDRPPPPVACELDRQEAAGHPQALFEPHVPVVVWDRVEVDAGLRALRWKSCYRSNLVLWAPQSRWA